MGIYRHITDLAAFAGTLSLAEAQLGAASRLVFIPADDLKRRRGAANRIAGGLPELPEPCREQVGTIALAAVSRGRPVLQWAVVKTAVVAAQAKGAKPEALEGYDGDYVPVELSGAEHCDIDPPFREALESGDAVRQGVWLFVRDGGTPL